MREACTGIKAVILDYGYTIVDFVLNERALRAAYEQAGALALEYASGELPNGGVLVREISTCLSAAIERGYLAHELAELDILSLVNACFGEANLDLPPDLARRVVTLAHLALSAETFLPPGNGDALRALHAAGYRLGLVSTVALPCELLLDDLHRLGILDLFDATIFSSEEGSRTPRARIYETALARLGIAGYQTLFVGDRLREDIAGPRAAGMRAMLTHQFRQEMPGPHTPQPDAILAALAELPDAVRRLGEIAVPRS